MNLKDLSQQSACAILEALVQHGVCSEHELFNLLTKNPPAEMKRAVDFVHTLFCNHDHKFIGGVKEIKELVIHHANFCGYVAEEPFEECWALPFHTRWLNETTTLMHELELWSEQQLLQTFNQAQPLLTLLAQYETDKPAALALALKVKGLVWFEQEVN